MIKKAGRSSRPDPSGYHFLNNWELTVFSHDDDVEGISKGSIMH